MQVCFKLEIRTGIGSSSDDVIFSHVVEMPFAPPVGMEVIDGDWSETVGSLVWSDGTLFAFAEPWKTNRRRTPEELAEEIALAESLGWVRSKDLLSV